MALVLKPKSTKFLSEVIQEGKRQTVNEVSAPDLNAAAS